MARSRPQLSRLAQRSSAPGAGSYARIYATVRRIPTGRVATYGQIAELAGLPGAARQVGYALSALPASSSVPWHRVVNASGGVSRRAIPGAETSQALRIAAEGIEVNARGEVKLARYRWRAGGRKLER